MTTYWLVFESQLGTSLHLTTFHGPYSYLYSYRPQWELCGLWGPSLHFTGYLACVLDKAGRGFSSSRRFFLNAYSSNMSHYPLVVSTGDALVQILAICFRITYCFCLLEYRAVISATSRAILFQKDNVAFTFFTSPINFASYNDM